MWADVTTRRLTRRCPAVTWSHPVPTSTTGSCRCFLKSSILLKGECHEIFTPDPRNFSLNWPLWALIDMLIKEFFQYGFDFAEIIVSKVRFFYSAVSNKLLSLTPRYINDTAEPDSAVAIAPAESDSAVSTTSSEFLTCKKYPKIQNHMHIYFIWFTKKSETT